MNKILLNILIFVGFQQFILGAEVNEEPKPKLGVCLYCYVIVPCTHDIYDTYKENQNNCTECVKEVYSVCPSGHTMCAECILRQVEDGVKNDRGVVKCYFFNQEKPIGKKEFNPCLAQIDKKVVIQILKKSKIDKKKLLEKYIEMQNEILFLEPQNKRCKYEECTGFFDVTKDFICNKNNSHEHCGKCFDKIHTGKCKDPLEEYKDYIQQNEEIHEKIKNKQLNYGDTEGYKPCPNCHKIIAKCTGCNHMTCGKHYDSGDWRGKGCGYQWCWRCGKACFYNDNDQGEPGNKHYDDYYPCVGKHFGGVDPKLLSYFDDGDYFGIKNGKFKEQFEKFAREGVIDIEVETPTKYPEITKKNWDAINKGKKEWKEKNPNEKYYEEGDNTKNEKYYEEGDNTKNEKYYEEGDNTKNGGIYDYCNDCCEKCFMGC